MKPDEWEEVAEYLWSNRSHLRGVALLGYFGDHLYDNAPYQTVVEGEPVEKEWQRLASIDWSQVNLAGVAGPTENPTLDAACAGGTCLI